MPLVVVTTNVAISPEQKETMAKETTNLFVNELKTSEKHVHVHVQDSQFFSFAGDFAAAAANVTVKCAHNSIDRDARTRLVNGFGPVLSHAIAGLQPERVYMTFEELPVQNIAVGSSIMVFDTMHTAASMEFTGPTHAMEFAGEGIGI